MIVEMNELQIFENSEFGKVRVVEVTASLCLSEKMLQRYSVIPILEKQSETM